MKKIKGKIILITGGAAGIGKSAAKIFAESDNTVIVWDINEKNLKTLNEEAAEKNLKIFGMICDITNREDVYRKAAETETKFGTVDILINNAGIVSGKTFLDSSDEENLLSMNVNAVSLFWTTKAFLPGMIKKGSGHLVTIASAAGLIGVKKLADYSASKFAAVGFTESLRMELSSLCKGIKTTTVCPFFIDTGMFDGVHSRFSFLLPILKQEYTAKKIVKAITKKKAMLIMPRFVNSLFIVRLFPIKIFDAIVSFFGINNTMDNFKGRK